jgi:hypothetical protein
LQACLQRPGREIIANPTVISTHKGEGAQFVYVNITKLNKKAKQKFYDKAFGEMKWFKAPGEWGSMDEFCIYR